MKRVAFLIPNLAKGGAERVLSNILLRLQTFEKYLILYEDRIDYPYLVEKKIVLDSPPVDYILLKFFRFLERYWRVKKLKSFYKFDVVVSFLEGANVINLITRRKEKVIISVREDKSKSFGRKGFIGKVYDLLIKLLYSRADAIVAVSQGVKASLVKIYGLPSDKIKVIYNPVDIAGINRLRSEPVEFDFGRYLISVGRLSLQKAQWHLLRIFKKIKEAFPGIKLLILGEGELKDLLIRLSENLGFRTFCWGGSKLSENYDVYFMGFKANPFKYISKAELFLFPSLWEGFPNALIEALACGVPVISSDCRSGPREILAPDTDFEYETKNPEFARYGVLMPVLDGKIRGAEAPLTDEEKVWADTVINLLKKKDLRKHYAEAAEKRAKDFSVRKIMKEWEEILVSEKFEE